MEKLLNTVEKYADLAKAACGFLWKNPETGCREWKAQAYLTEGFRALGYQLTEAGNIPGFYTDVDTGRLGHGNNYYVADPDLAVVGLAKGMMAMTHLQLKDGAQRARKIKAKFVPTFASVEECFACIHKLDMDKDAVIYNEDGTVTLDYQK